MAGWAVLGVTLVCYAVAVAVYGDRSVQRLMAEHAANVHPTSRGGAM